MTNPVKNPFLTLRCPICGTIMEATNLKSSDDTDTTVTESYVCDCGTRFNVEMTITKTL